MGSPAMVVDPEGEGVSLAWLNSENGLPGIRFMQLDQRAEVVLERQLAPTSGQMRLPRLVSARNNDFQLLWASRSSAKEKWGLWFAPLSSQGDISGSAMQISSAEMNVKDYISVPSAEGYTLVIWSISNTSGLYGVRIDGAGGPLGNPILINEKGSSPSAKFDSRGDLHLSWVSEDTFYYAVLPDGEIQAAEGISVHRLSLSTGDSLSGPVLGLTGDLVYMIWSVQSQSGLAAGTARTEFTSFPHSSPQASNPQPVWLLPLEEQPLQPYQGNYLLSVLTAPADPASGSDFVHQPAVSSSRGSELAAAVSVKQQYRQDIHIQIALCVFENGRFIGYEMASKTKALSSEPLLAGDASGNLHLVWRQGAMGRDLYYATTAPAARLELNKLNSGDYINAVLTGGMESFVGILFFPWIGFGWLLPGLMVVGIWKLVRDYDKLSESRASLLLLILALAVYQLMKVLTLPSILVYVPFTAWIEVPNALAGVLRAAVPLVIFGLALLTAEYVRRRKSDSAIKYYFAFAGVDAVLTLAIYGVGFLGVY